MTARPVLGLALGPHHDALLARFLVVASRRCLVRQADADDRVDAWIASDDADPALLTATVPLLVWTRDPERAAARWPSSAILLAPASSARSPGQAIVVAEPAVDLSTTVYVAPLVRERWRQRYWLPQDLVMDLRAGQAPELTSSLRRAALATAAVVVGAGDTVPEALAWGAPTVTDEFTARRFALGPAVLAVPADQTMAAARDLASSAPRMAELSWAGRRLAESKFDLASSVRRALDAAQLARAEPGPRGVQALLTELWASPGVAELMIRQIQGDSGPVR